MNRVILLVFAVLVSCVSAAVGNDYILRIDTMGYSEEPASAIEPQETAIRSIEVLVRPDFPFHGRVSLEAETMVLCGKLRSADNGDFVVQFRNEHLVDTGMTVADKDGSHEPEILKSWVQTSVTISIDTALEVGGVDVQKSRLGEQTLNSITRHVLTLTKYDPLRD